MRQYKDFPIDLADTSLVAMAEVLNKQQILTIDHDFHIYRLFWNETFEVIP